MEKDFLSISDISRDDYIRLMDTAMTIKADIPAYYNALQGKTAVLIFDKPSLRTRVTFEVAMCQFGGKSIYMPGQDVQLGVRESVADGARNLSRWVDGIVMRTFGHGTIEELAANAAVPVVNALTDLSHPCQALACILTLREHVGDVTGKTLVFVGDGNNVAHSLMLLCPLAGMDFVMCCPEGYEPDESIVELTLDSADRYGTSYRLTHDYADAVERADLVYTDVWASMGQEEEADSRTEIFRPFQVNASLMERAPDACLVSHCLPAHRGEEISSDVLDGPRSIAFDEAENRLHVQKAVLYELLGGRKRGA
ncbi:MAG: ornithine carbamoyltransferase [Candidatus Latescibacteria bacterium]|nr:ornithine carbamoyltransferase [Candidatus Latescibacterota bacterium]